MAEQDKWLEFARFVPGFDFLRNLAPPLVGEAAASPPGASAFQQWLAPTMDPAEVQKRIDELKVVKFWLEQNGRALEASIQALEVQKMTLATLGAMNRGASTWADALQDGFQEAAQGAAHAFDRAAAPQRAQAPSDAQGQHGQGGENAAADAGDPTVRLMQQQAVQWWAALTEQFQAIAQKAVEDMGQNMAAAAPAADAAGDMAPESATKARRPAARRSSTPRGAARAKPATGTGSRKASAAKSAATTRRSAGGRK